MLLHGELANNPRHDTGISHVPSHAASSALVAASLPQTVLAEPGLSSLCQLAVTLRGPFHQVD